jgi:hypothetical protein
MTGSSAEKKGASHRPLKWRRFKEAKPHKCQWCGIKCDTLSSLKIHERDCQGPQERRIPPTQRASTTRDPSLIDRTPPTLNRRDTG